jgi:hypothetical protein
MKRPQQVAEQPRAEAREWIARVAGIVALIVGVDYVAWRFAVTLNPAAMWLSLPVWLAELYGLLSTVLFTFIVWGPMKRRLAAAPSRRSVLTSLCPHTTSRCGSCGGPYSAPVRSVTRTQPIFSMTPTVRRWPPWRSSSDASSP